MAAVYTVKFKSVCSGGEHILLDAYKDGVFQKTLTLTRTELNNNAADWQDVIAFLCKKVVTNAGATTAAEKKAAIEAIQVTL